MRRSGLKRRRRCAASTLQSRIARRVPHPHEDWFLTWLEQGILTVGLLVLGWACSGRPAKVGPPDQTRCRESVTSITAAILRHIESLGYAVSVHRMGDYCEIHAVFLADPDQQHITRLDGDSDEDACRTARLLAGMVGIELEDG